MINQRKCIPLLLFCFLFFLISCDKDENENTNEDELINHTVFVGNFYYDPPNITINLGEQVTWINDGGLHDVNGEIAVINVDMALEHCGWEEGDILRRKTCWHGIGKYIARVDIDRAFEACSRVPNGPNNLYVENCHHGLGWGGSEQTGKAFLPTCDRSGDYKDSCMLGVAYNLRRFDVEQGLEICDMVQRKDLQQQCIDFVGG